MHSGSFVVFLEHYRCFDNVYGRIEINWISILHVTHVIALFAISTLIYLIFFITCTGGQHIKRANKSAIAKKVLKKEKKRKKKERKSFSVCLAKIQFDILFI